MWFTFSFFSLVSYKLQSCDHMGNCQGPSISLAYQLVVSQAEDPSVQLHSFSRLYPALLTNRRLLLSACFCVHRNAGEKKPDTSISVSAYLVPMAQRVGDSAQHLPSYGKSTAARQNTTILPSPSFKNPAKILELRTCNSHAFPPTSQPTQKPKPKVHISFPK